MPTSIVTTASSASRAFHGYIAACADSPVKLKVGRHQRRLHQPVDRAELAGDVIVKGDVDIVEIAVAHEIGSAQQLLFGGRAEDLERALELELLHRMAQRQGDAETITARIDVVTFAMSGRAGDDLARSVTPDFCEFDGLASYSVWMRDDRRAAAVGREESRGKAGDAALDAKAVLIENLRHERRAAVFLHADFAEIEQRVA